LGLARPGEGFNRSWEYWCRRAGINPNAGRERAMGFRSEFEERS
jgi:hypothetical protein